MASAYLRPFTTGRTVFSAASVPGELRDEVFVSALPLTATPGPPQLLMSAAYSLKLWDLRHYVVVLRPRFVSPHPAQVAVSGFSPFNPLIWFTVLVIRIALACGLMIWGIYLSFYFAVWRFLCMIFNPRTPRTSTLRLPLYLETEYQVLSSLTSNWIWSYSTISTISWSFLHIINKLEFPVAHNYTFYVIMRWSILTNT